MSFSSRNVGGKWLHVKIDNETRLLPMLRKQYPRQVKKAWSGTVFIRGQEQNILFASTVEQTLPSSSASFSSTSSSSSAFSSFTSDVSITFASSKPKLVVSADDCLNVAAKYDHPLVLVFGSDRFPNGGYHRGVSNAQDEHVTYCCPIYHSIVKQVFDEIRNKQDNEERRGPWLKDSECIYTPGVLVCRTSDLKEKSDFNQEVNLLYQAAIRNPVLNRERMDYANAHTTSIAEDKIRTQFRVARRFKHRNLILGAFGCGCFNNPVKKTIDMYLAICDEAEFQSCFDCLDFAMLDAGYNYSIFVKAVNAFSFTKTLSTVDNHHQHEHQTSQQTFSLLNIDASSSQTAVVENVNAVDTSFTATSLLSKNQKRRLREKERKMHGNTTHRKD